MATHQPKIVNTTPLPSKNKKKKSKCSYKNGKNKCKKKLKLTDMSCRCGKRFCSTHRLPENHNCSIDYAQIKKDIYFQHIYI